MLADLEPIQSDPEAVIQRGVEWSARQCGELLAEGIDGLHFYTLNKSKASR